MTNCTQCGQTTAAMKVENVDGVYEIYSWTCSSCGETVRMALGHAEHFQLPDYVVNFDDLAPAHVVAKSVAARRQVAA